MCRSFPFTFYFTFLVPKIQNPGPTISIYHKVKKLVPERCCPCILHFFCPLACYLMSQKYATSRASGWGPRWKALMLSGSGPTLKIPDCYPCHVYPLAISQLKLSFHVPDVTVLSLLHCFLYFLMIKIAE